MEQVNPKVAPFVGVWIEIGLRLMYFSGLRVVALPVSAWIEMCYTLYILMQIRCRTLHGCVDWNYTAKCDCCKRVRVAPFMGAWIEMLLGSAWYRVQRAVAPFMGAWIEILVNEFLKFALEMSHSPWVCGLK